MQTAPDFNHNKWGQSQIKQASFCTKIKWGQSQFSAFDAFYSLSGIFLFGLERLICRFGLYLEWSPTLSRPHSETALLLEI